MAWFCNYYKCGRCGDEWEDHWSSKVDKDCPYCGYRHVQPFSADDVTFEIGWHENKYVVMRSADASEDRPNYEVIAAFDSMKSALVYLDEMQGWGLDAPMEDRGFGT
jgi:predicted  nucleic acid-binding Zn-ribbon protein